MAKELAEKVARDGYVVGDTTTGFADFLSFDLRKFSKGLHFQVTYSPDFKAPIGNAVPSADELTQERGKITRSGYGIAHVDRLPGNVGYIDLRELGASEFVGATYTSALSLLAGTDALILDLRRNMGGDPASVSFLLSHFFGADFPPRR